MTGCLLCHQACRTSKEVYCSTCYGEKYKRQCGWCAKWTISPPGRPCCNAACEVLFIQANGVSPHVTLPYACVECKKQSATPFAYENKTVCSAICNATVQQQKCDWRAPFASSLFSCQSFFYFEAPVSKDVDMSPPESAPISAAQLKTELQICNVAVKIKPMKKRARK